MTSKNHRVQGAVGVAMAIAHYAEQGFAVWTPVSDVSRYDLVVDFDGRLLRVEVKTTGTKSGTVSLRTMGGNRTRLPEEVKRISTEDCDLVFCYNVVTGGWAEFPAAELEGRASIVVK